MTTPRSTTTRAPARRRGRPSRFSGKDRTAVITLTMSPGGHAALGRLRKADPKATRAEVIEAALRAQAALVR